MPYIPPENELDYIVDEDENEEELETIDDDDNENEADYSSYEYSGPDDIGVPDPDSSGETPTPEEPEETQYVVTYRDRALLSNFEPSYLYELFQNGAKFYAIYDDDSEEEVSWDEIEDLNPLDTIVDLSEAIASATNQHFWNDDQGVHVAEVNKESWQIALGSNFSDLSSSKNYYNLLTNSLGLLFRRALYNLVSITRTAISFYDGTGNESSNVMAYFGRDSAQIGRNNSKHLSLNSEGITAYNADGTVAPLQAANITAAEANIEQLQANTADISTIRANSAKVASLTADALTAATAYIAALNTLNVTANDISANKATLNSLIAGNVTADTIRAASAYISALTSASVTANDISANKATLGALIADNVTTDTLRAASAYISSLTASNISASTLTADHANVTTIIADYLTSADIQAEQIRVGQLLAGYMETDFSNADVAWIENGTIKDGAITNAMINSVSANKLTAGTIDASNITVTNLNADNITTGTINGQRIGEGSLSLSKLEDDVYTETEVDTMLSTIDATLSNMQAEIDGAIETWTGTTVPTLSNAPASGWTTNAVKDTHVGDVYFVVNSQSQQNGYNYRFTKSGSGNSATYSWQLIKDNDVTNALQRLTTAEGKITTFDSDISQLKTDTGSLTTRTTTLETRADGIDSTLLDKVDVTDFNSLEDTVDGHTQTLSQHTTAISNKADSSTVTAVTNRVSQNEQNISGITTRVGSLETTVATKADSSTVTTVSNNLSTLSQTVDSFQSTVASTYATKESVDNIKIGGRNLLRSTPTAYNKKGYLVYSIPASVSLDEFSAGDNITLQLWGVDLDSGSSGLRAYWGGSSVCITPTIFFPDETGYVLVTITISQQWLDHAHASNKFIYIYNFTSGHSGSSLTIDHWKLEKGNKGTDWTPSPEDNDAKYTFKDESRADYLKTQSRGEQLITNGNGMMGDNTNFSQLIFDGSKSNGSPGSFTKSAGTSAEILTDEYFPVDPSKEYEASFDVLSSGDGVNARMYAQLNMYDVDKKRITVQCVSYYPNTTTTLAQDLKPEDTIVHLTDASNWHATSAPHQRSLIFWNYTNSAGYLYPIGTYSRNYYVGVYENDSSVDKQAGTITLSSPWSGNTIAAGTPVSQNTSGGSYAYFWIDSNGSKILVDEWLHASGLYSGTKGPQGANSPVPPSTSFWHGTAYCKIGWLWNYQSGTTGTQRRLWITNVSMKINNASAADVKSLTTRVTSAESTIEQHSTSIALKANSADVYTKTQSDGLISTEVTNRNAAIQVATEGITSMVSETYTSKEELSNALDSRVHDNDSWVYRQVPDNVQDGIATIESISGNTVVWNQILNPSVRSVTGGGVTLTMTDGGFVTISGTATGNNELQANQNKFNVVSGHKYLAHMNSNAHMRFKFYIGSASIGMYPCGSTIVEATAGGEGVIRYRLNSSDSSTDFDETYTTYLMVFDLTTMFGAGNEPSTVAEFEALFPEPYYPYDAGSLLSVQMEGVETVGFNQWDEQWELGNINNTTGEDIADTSMIRSKNYIPVFPSTQYYMRNQNGYVFAYDADKTFISTFQINTTPTPANCRYIRFRLASNYGTTYNHDICINISNPTLNGTYKPYATYQRAIPAATYFPNGMRSVGTVHDELTSDAAIVRVGAVDLGTLTWIKGNALNDGTGHTFRANYTSLSGLGNGAITCACAELYCPPYKSTWENLTKGEIEKHAAGFIIGGDSSLTTSEFKASLSGVIAYFALSTPTTTPIDPPLTMTYRVEQGGTERVTHTDLTAPPTIDIQYGLRTMDSISDALLRIESAESSITQNATDISLKVSKNDVINQINVSTEGATINANRVNITGEAVFSAINNDTGTTKINGGKIDATAITIGQSQVTGLDTALNGKADDSDISAIQDDLNSSRVWYAVCDTVAATVSKVATISPATTDFTLEIGRMVNVRFVNTNTGAVGSLTLNVNDTGAKPIKNFYNGTISNLSSASYLRANSIITFKYDGTNWIADLTVNSTYNQGVSQLYNSIKAKTSITEQSIIVGDANGYSMAAAGITFDLSYPILWTTANIAANGTNYENVFTSHYNLNLATNHGFSSGTPNSIVYLVGTVIGNTFTLASSYLTTTVPVSEDGYCYIPIGRLGNPSTGGNYFYFFCVDKPTLYTYKDGSFGPASIREASAAAKTATNYISLDSTGIRIANANPATATTYQHQTAANTEFIVDGVSSAEFSGSGGRIGSYNGIYTVLNNNQLTLAGYANKIFSVEVEDVTPVPEGDDVIQEITQTSFTTARPGGVEDWYIKVNQLWIPFIQSITGASGALVENTDYFINKVDGTIHITKRSANTVTVTYSMIPTKDYNTSLTLYDGKGIGTNNKLMKISNDSTVIGKTNESHIVLDYHSMQMVDDEGNTYFHVSDLRDKEGCITNLFVGDGETFEFQLNMETTSVKSVKVNGTEVGYESVLGDTVELATAPEDGAEVEIRFVPYPKERVKAYTLGMRSSGYAIGPFSVAEGYEVISSAHHSHAEGIHSSATGSSSHAEGCNTKASGDTSHAEGYVTEASGDFAHSQNFFTVAGSDYQTAIGKYNDNGSTNAFEIGNGTADDSRSNALTVDWDGNIESQGALYIHNGRQIFGGSSTSINLYHRDDNDTEDFRIQFYVDSNGHPALRGSLDGGSTWEYPYPNQYASHTANTVWATPNGSNGSAGFRSLVAADIPNLNASKITAGNLDIPGTIASDGSITSGAAIYAHNGQEIFGGTDALIRIYHRANNSEDFRFDFYIDSNGNPAMRASLDAGSSWKYPYLNQLSSRTANTVLAGPNGSNGAPSFRALVADDIPNLNASKINAGAIGTARGGTGVSGRQSSTITVDTSNVTVGDTNHCWHNGVVCSFSYNFKPKASLANNGTLAVGTLPSGYRPPYAFVGSAYTSTSSAQVDVTISTAGVITVRNVSGAAIATSVTIRVGGTFAL